MTLLSGRATKYATGGHAHLSGKAPLEDQLRGDVTVYLGVSGRLSKGGVDARRGDTATEKSMWTRLEMKRQFIREVDGDTYGV